MMSLSNMKVGTKLGLGFGAVIALLVLVAVIGISNIRALNADVNDMVKDKFPKTVWANNVIDQINIIARAMRNTLILDDPAKVKKEIERVGEARKVILENFDKLKETITSEKGKELLGKALDARGKYVSSQDQFLKLAGEGKQAEAKVYLLTEVRDLQNAYIDAVSDLIHFQSDLMEETGAKAAEEAQSATNMMIVLAVIAMLVGIFVAYLIVRGLLKQLGGEPDYAAGVAQKIADGDLSMAIATKQGDTTSLLASMKVMQEALKRIVGDVQRIVEAANKGDFSVKLDKESHKGFARDIAGGLNQLSDTIEGAFGDTVRVASALAAGDLSQKVTTEYTGAFNQVKVAVNTTVDSLTKIVAEIQTIVDDANRGDFSTKMDLKGKAGYTQTLSELLNQLSDTVDGAFNDTIRVAQALAAGDLSQKVTTEYQGAYNDVKVAVNGTVDALTKIVAEIQQIVEAANRGDFSIKMSLEGKAGYTKTLSTLLNQLSDTVDTAFKDTIHVAQALAQGDLTKTVTRDYQGAFNDVKENLNTTVANLKQLVVQIKESVDAINTASKEIASGNQDLSQRTEEQA
ncbi:MAG: MCP four helix bundle domain-containing protein, partial [Sulfuricellaceae bacterium]